MKKSLFLMAAASALMLTACTSEDDVLQSSAPQKAEAKALGFDVYLPQAANVTRAGDPLGVMTTEKLKTADKGFGVFAFYHDNATYPANNTTFKPDFMYNEHVHWSSGWTYSPLKYWPNETDIDSQSPAAEAASDNVDKLSFFAYAPYVDNTVALGSSGITALTANTATSDPKVTFAINTDPDANVDLLWGVAPAGFSYTNVSGNNTSVPVGMPLTNLVKPDKDQRVKFLFQHALSRIGLSVVSAIDQIAAGDDGNKFTADPTTKVLIKSVSITGPFGKQGLLNLNNTTANVANWESITADPASSALFTINGKTVDGETSSAAGNFYLAPDLRYVATQISAVSGDGNASKFALINTGVLPSEQTLLAGDIDPSKDPVTGTPAFTFGKVYYKSAGTGDKGYVVASLSHTNSSDLFIKDANGNYTQVYKSSDGTITLDGNSPTYYEVTPGTAATAALTANDYYYKEEGTAAAGDLTYTKIKATGSETDYSTVNYYPVEGTGHLTADPTDVSSDTYDSDTYYTALIPRYFMVIPTGSAIDIKVNIKYAVVTKDAKLNGNVSNVENDITKQISLNLESGKSYNLKLILGLTSVKLDATVADWLVADDAEVYLPKNNE